MRGTHRTTELYWVLLLALILGGEIWLRGGNLGSNSFFVDEYFHVYAAQGLLEHGQPLMPGGGVYRRALPYSYAVAAFFKIFGVSEWSARLPSLIASSLLVLLVFAAGRCWFGVAAGLLAAAIVAVGPPLTFTARLCRMYAPFELLYLAALFAYERGWEQKTIADGSPFWKIATPLLLYASYRMHSLTANFVPAIALYWVLMLATVGDRRYALYLLGAIGAVLLVWASGIIDVGSLWSGATAAPAWAVRGKEFDFYVSAWAGAYRGLWWIVGAAVLFACARLGRRGVLLACQLVVPLTLLSLVFARKEQRYASFLFPLMALLVAPFLVWMVREIVAWLRRTIWRSEAPVPFALKLVVAAQIAVLAIAWLAPSIRISYAMRSAYMPDYRAAYARIAALAHPGDALFTSVGYSAVYYLGRDGVALQSPDAEAGSPGLWLRWYRDGRWQQTLADLQRARRTQPRGWLVTEQGWFANDSIIAFPVRQFIGATMRPEPIEDGAGVMVFRWGQEPQSP